MLTFNLLLKEEGIDPKDVYLVRHQDTRNSRQSVYNLYKSALLQFEIYQGLQRKDSFGGRPLIASFIAAPSDRTLFVGLYRNKGLDAFPETLHECPFSGVPVGPETFVYYRLEPDPQLEEFKEKLSIQWGAGYRAWVQNADAKSPATNQSLSWFALFRRRSFPDSASLSAMSPRFPPFGLLGTSISVKTRGSTCSPAGTRAGSTWARPTETTDFWDDSFATRLLGTEETKA